jgi:hypothetical protein
MLTKQYPVAIAIIPRIVDRIIQSQDSVTAIKSVCMGSQPLHTNLTLLYIPSTFSSSMGFFENATGFTIGTSNNNDIAPGATVTCKALRLAKRYDITLTDWQTPSTMRLSSSLHLSLPRKLQHTSQVKSMGRPQLPNCPPRRPLHLSHS